MSEWFCGWHFNCVAGWSSILGLSLAFIGILGWVGARQWKKHKNVYIEAPSSFSLKSFQNNGKITHMNIDNSTNHYHTENK